LKPSTENTDSQSSFCTPSTPTDARAERRAKPDQKSRQKQKKNKSADERRLGPRDVDTLITGNSKAKTLLDWKPKTTFQEGIRKTIQGVPQKPQAMRIRKTWMARVLLTSHPTNSTTCLDPTPTGGVGYAYSKETVTGQNLRNLQTLFCVN
jgi:hypothetical protein